MGLPRSSESFQRVYSAPEPPKAARRPRVLALLIAAVSFVVAAVAVFLLVPGGGDGARRTPDRDRAAPPAASPGEPSASSEPSGKPSGSPSASPNPPQARPFGALPAPCTSVKQDTIKRIVPGARRSEQSNSTLTTCTFSSGGDGFRWLRVEGHLYAPGNTGTPVEDAKRYYDAQWRQAHGATLERTISLEGESGLGDEAFLWFKADKGMPTVVGQATARFRNAVVTVGYSEQARGEGGAAERERACLAKAREVAAEVLAGLR